jgi:quercetin dioxygenase-like cupin family protein
LQEEAAWFDKGGENSMILVKANEGTVYDAKGHFNMWGIRKVGAPEGAQSVTLSISEFLPDGGASLSAADKERVYYVLRGSISVKDEHGTEYVVNENDAIYIAPGEKREMSVNGILAARVLVFVVSKN